MLESNETIHEADPTNAQRVSVTEDWQSIRTKKSVLIGVHCTPRLAESIDRYIEAELEDIKRPEAIRQILKRWLVSNGYFK